MTDPARIATAAGLILLVNVPFGYWRGGLRKLSAPWFVAIHAPVPLAMGIRLLLGLEFRWANLPYFAAAFFAGQIVGVRVRTRVLARGRTRIPATASRVSRPERTEADPE